MPRLPFNTTCSVYRGPNHADAGDLVGVFDCRLVLENGIQQFAGQPNRLGWITIQVYAVEHGWTDDPLSYDPLLADRIAIPDDAAEPQYQVWYADVINWKSQAEYDRLNVIAAIPDPGGGDALPSGGETCTSAVTIETDVEYSFDTDNPLGYYRWPTTDSPVHFIVNLTAGSIVAHKSEFVGGPFEQCVTALDELSGSPCYEISTDLGGNAQVQLIGTGASGTITFSTGSCP